MSAAQMLETLLASETTGDLLVLFHRNPGLIDTLDSIARRIGRIGNAIEDDVRSLVNLGILKTRRIGRSEVLLLDRARDREVLDAIAKHLRNLEGVGKIDNAQVLGLYSLESTSSSLRRSERAGGSGPE